MSTLINNTDTNNVAQTPIHSPDEAYHRHLADMQGAFTRLVENEKNLFRVNVSKLADEYVSAIPEASRQYYNCHACRSFIKHYGSLVVINDDGSHVSPIWFSSIALPEHAQAVELMAKLVRKAPVVNVFITDSDTLGQPVVNDHHHLSLKLPLSLVAKSHATRSLGQRVANAQQNYQNVHNYLLPNPKTDHVSLSALERAAALFEADILPNRAKFLPAVDFLLALKRQLDASKNVRHQQALVWKAVASAPDGFCHPRNSAIGALIEDIEKGAFAQHELVRRFSGNTAAEVYMRPVAPPSEGTIATAEKLFAELGLASALRRRFARLEEIDAIWRPTPTEKPAEKTDAGLFGDLRQPSPTVKAVPAPLKHPTLMSFNRFIERIFPQALEIEICLPNTRLPLSGIVTAVDPNAKPLMKWDSEEKRNPFSTYGHVSGALPQHFSLAANTFYKVTAVTKNVDEWFGSVPPGGPVGTYLLIIEGAKEANPIGTAIFPEVVRRELLEVRSVIEARSKRDVMEGADEASACGLQVGIGSFGIPIELRVKTATSDIIYAIDRNEA